MEKNLFTPRPLYQLMKKLEIVVVAILVLLVSAAIGCGAVSNSPLPHSMKGYELYSWQENGEWHFTLITGTNRNKNLEEIISGEDDEFENGGGKIRTEGVEGIKAALSRVPEGEWVSWSDGQFVIMPEGSDIKLELPPQDIIDEVKEWAEGCGLDFNAY